MLVDDDDAILESSSDSGSSEDTIYDLSDPDDGLGVDDGCEDAMICGCRLFTKQPTSFLS